MTIYPEGAVRAGELAKAQARILELAMQDTSLPETLEAIVRTVEELSTATVLASILLLDEDGMRLRHGAAPSLPAAYNEAIDGIAVGPGVGSCGTVAFSGEPVYVSDIANDPLWADFKDLALSFGLEACWSTPVRSSVGMLLGTFALYYGEPRVPDADDIELIDFVARSAGLVIERKRSEQALRAANELLEMRVAERTDELLVAEEALRQSQKLEAIGQLTGGVAHDFNNLLTVIRGSVDLLRKPDLSEERRTRYIEAIGETADRAAKLTNQLLAFARRQALRPEIFDVAQSLDDIAGMVRTLTGSRIVLDISHPDAAALVNTDRSQFETAIVNIAVNARDAMKGEGNLSIASGMVTGIPARRNHAAMSGDFVAITIADTGTGIADEDIGRIFEPFFTTKSIGQGTGLGLSQVFGFAKQAGGDVQVASEIGRGTIFTLYLPRVLVDDTAKPVLVEPQSLTRGDGVCVLVVEDNASVGSFAVEALHELGYSTVLATDAKQALEELGRGPDRFDIVFSDVVMPGMTGLELGEIIRRDYPDVPVILTSGYSHVLARNGQHGFELLHKPYSMEQLSRALHKAILWQKHLRQAKQQTGEVLADPVDLR